MPTCNKLIKKPHEVSTTAAATARIRDLDLMLEELRPEEAEQGAQ